MRPDRTYAAYWERYLLAHADPRVRQVHFVATAAALGMLAAGVLGRRLLLVVGAPLVAMVPVRLARRRFAAPAPPPHLLYAPLASLQLWVATLLGTLEAKPDQAATAKPAAAAHEASRPRKGAPMPEPNMVTDHTLH